MDPYLFSLLLGALGVFAMALGGLASHGGHAGHGHGGHDLGHHDVGGHHLGHGHGHGADAGHAHGHGHEGGEGLTSHVLALLAPRALFSMLAGAGAVGLLARPALGEPWTAVVAVAGGVAFERLLAGPLWKLVFRFASRPAATLEHALLEPATAATGFDAAGDGLIRLVLDGQTRQLLGTLRPEDRAAGVRVRAGDRLTIEAVTPTGDRCVVSWVGPADGPAR